MKNRVFSILGTLVIDLGFCADVYAQMQSTNYRITTTVMSGGGRAMGSSNYQINGTEGYYKILGGNLNARKRESMHEP